MIQNLVLVCLLVTILKNFQKWLCNIILTLKAGYGALYFLHPSWRAKPASWGVLRLFWITCVYIYIYICMYAPQCLSTRCIGGTSIGDALATGIQAPAGPCKLMNIAI